MDYNFCRKHATIKTTPAVAAGVANHQWTFEEVVAVIDRHTEASNRAKADAVFTAAMANITPQRTTPKSYKPTPKDQIPVPWYLQGFKDNQENS